MINDTLSMKNNIPFFIERAVWHPTSNVLKEILALVTSSGRRVINAKALEKSYPGFRTTAVVPTDR